MIKPLLLSMFAVKLAGLKATVFLLLILLIKSNLLRVKMSFLGSLLALYFVTSFLAITGLMTTIAAGATYFAYKKRQ